jgi:hypothetical protein
MVSAFAMGHRINRPEHGRSPRFVLFAVSLLFCLAFSWIYAGNLSWAYAIPVSGVVYWSNFMPVLLGFAAGAACHTAGLNGFGRPLTIASLMLIAVSYLVIPVGRPIVLPVTVSEAVWDDEVCLQSHESTCAAASAATLLRLNEIDADEASMVGPCLTSQQGTESLGLYRGLRLASQNTSRQVRVAQSNPTDWLMLDQLPNIALVKFAENEYAGANTPRRIRWMSGVTGEGHAVVVLGHENGQWIIGDPAVGRVRWSDADLRRRFTGEAIYMTP